MLTTTERLEVAVKIVHPQAGLGCFGDSETVDRSEGRACELHVFVTCFVIPVGVLF